MFKHRYVGGNEPGVAKRASEELQDYASETRRIRKLVLLAKKIVDLALGRHDHHADVIEELYEDSANLSETTKILDRLSEESMRDGNLKDVYNDKFFKKEKKKIDSRIEKRRYDKKYAEKHPEVYAILYIDVDGLKKVNDNTGYGEYFGHAAGDLLIRHVADGILDVVRQGEDKIIRSHKAGDEFVVVLKLYPSDDNDKKVEDIIQRIKDSIRDKTKADSKGTQGNRDGMGHTASIGWSYVEDCGVGKKHTSIATKKAEAGMRAIKNEKYTILEDYSI